MASTSAFLNRGDIVANRYRIDKLLGQGGMGVVFQAVHLGTDHLVALKLLHPHLVRDPKVRAMFAREARVGARIKKNPHIVDVFDTGIDPRHGVAYIAMECLQGMTLEDYVRGFGPMRPNLLLTLWWQLCNVLTQAHAAGVVHRDLKPSNLFVSLDHKNQPRLVVLDFGIAKFINSNEYSPVTPVGTPAYAAPEQRGFIGSSAISPATDLWALGIITYELLSGNHPNSLWQIRRADKATDDATTDPTTLAISHACRSTSLLPRGFEAWLSKSLAQNPDDRWQCAEDAINELVKLFGADKQGAKHDVPNTCIVISKGSEHFRHGRTNRHNRHIERLDPYASTGKQTESTLESRNINAFNMNRIKKSGPLFFVSASVVLMITLPLSRMNSTSRETKAIELVIPGSASMHISLPAAHSEATVHTLTSIPRKMPRLNDDGNDLTDMNSADASPISSNPDAEIKFVSSAKCLILVDGKPGGHAPVAIKLSSSRQHVLSIHCEPDHFGFCQITPNPGTTTTLEITDPVEQLDKSHGLEKDCSIWQKR